MLTLDEYLNHWKERYGTVHVSDFELTDRMRENAETTVTRANALLRRYGSDRGITSGWRPEAVNRLIPGAAVRSNHTRCMAVDLADPDGTLDEWCFSNPGVLEEIGLWQEHPAATKGWCHLQIVGPASGKRVFYP